jgi:hypothetical protein
MLSGGSASQAGSIGVTSWFARGRIDAAALYGPLCRLDVREEVLSE